MTPFYLLWYINELQQKRENLKNITTNTKGTNASWDILRKATSIKARRIHCNFNNTAHESTLRN